jgi:hypothetical protein
MSHLLNAVPIDSGFAQIQRELMGRCFSNKKELRHLAEGAGFNFVPVEVLEGGDREILAALRPKGVGEIHVRAHRSRLWHPFYVTSVEAA